MLSDTYMKEHLKRVSSRSCRDAENDKGKRAVTCSQDDAIAMRSPIRENAEDDVAFTFIIL